MEKRGHFLQDDTQSAQNVCSAFTDWEMYSVIYIITSSYAPRGL